MSKPPLLGVRYVLVSNLPKSTFEEITPKLFGVVKPDTLVIMTDPTEVLGKGPMEHLIKLGGAKGIRFGHYVVDGEFPDWLQFLDHLIIHIDNPKAFTNSDKFNEAIQDLWFGRGRVHIRVVVRHQDDLDMVELLYSYTPNDLDFWIEIQAKDQGVINHLQGLLLTRQFSTVRLSINPASLTLLRVPNPTD